jgi:hypothetical protein
MFRFKTESLELKVIEIVLFMQINTRLLVNRV